MSKLYVKASETLRQLRSDAAGVVSFEYVIVAACIIATVLAVFTATGNNTISGALAGAITSISSKLSP
jgi:pilus assembly protein Flp/PilA